VQAYPIGAKPYLHSQTELTRLNSALISQPVQTGTRLTLFASIQPGIIRQTPVTILPTHTHPPR